MANETLRYWNYLNAARRAAENHGDQLYSWFREHFRAHPKALNRRECRAMFRYAIEDALGKGGLGFSDSKGIKMTNLRIFNPSQVREIVEAKDAEIAALKAEVAGLRSGIRSVIKRVEQLHDSPNSLLSSLIDDLPAMRDAINAKELK